MRIGEIFGYDVSLGDEEVWKSRNAQLCPFRGSRCTKGNKTDPLGICSLTDGVSAAVTCPVRFLEDNRIFRDVGLLSFGEGSKICVLPEISILRIEGTGKKVGKVDFLIGKIVDDELVDYAILEVQAVYFSGGETRTALSDFMNTKDETTTHIHRRPDFRSSAQKRLIPQLNLKMPVFRRWGKKVFVAVDQKFFSALPEFKRVDPENSEITWLCYPFSRSGDGFEIGEPSAHHSLWDDIQFALREGEPPTPSEFLTELQGKFKAQKKARILDL